MTKEQVLKVLDEAHASISVVVLIQDEEIAEDCENVQSLIENIIKKVKNL